MSKKRQPNKRNSSIKPPSTSKENLPEIITDPEKKAQLDSILSNIPDEESKNQLKSLIFSIEKTEVSPFPSPDRLAGYQNVSPEVLNTILQFCVNEQSHRQNVNQQVLDLEEKESNNRFLLEKAKLDGEIADSKRGQWFALLFALSALGLGFTAVMYGYEWGGAIISAIGIGTIVTAFIRGRNNTPIKEDTINEDKE